jgi:hypothetical protein
MPSQDLRATYEYLRSIPAANTRTVTDCGKMLWKTITAKAAGGG